MPAKPVVLTFDDGFADLYTNAWPVLKNYGFTFTVFAVSDRLGQANRWDGIAPGQLPLVSAGQLREMALDGARVEAHSRTHPLFLHLNDSEVPSEIEGPRQELLSLLSRRPEFFAYPYGQFRPRDRSHVFQSQYLGASSTIPGLNTIRTDLFRLRRINISGRDPMVDFGLKLRYGLALFTIENLKETIKQILNVVPALQKGEFRRGMEFHY